MKNRQVPIFTKAPISDAKASSSKVPLKPQSNEEFKNFGDRIGKISVEAKPQTTMKSKIIVGGLVIPLKPTSNNAPAHAERRRIPTHEDLIRRKKLAERKRCSTQVECKGDLNNVERERKPTISQLVGTPGHSVDKGDKKLAITRKESNHLELTCPERKRREIQRNESKTNTPMSSKNAKNRKGSSGLRKIDCDKTKLREASNKHVVVPLPNSNHTNTAQYNPHITYSKSPLAPHPSFTDTDTHTQDQPTINDTNLVLQPSPEDALPFLTKKSSMHPVVRHAFCDRISVTIDIPNRDIEEIIFIARDLFEPTGDDYSLRRWRQIGRELYNHSYKLVDKNRKQVALFQFGPKNSKAKFARLELNPNAIGTEGIEQVRRILKALVGPNYRECLADGNLTHFDATVDILKIRPDDVMIFSDRARASSLWQRGFNADGREEWTTETLSLGSPTSDYFVMAYDKAAQLWKVKGICLDDLRMRIEVGINPRSKGVSHLVKNILQIKNPFAPINIAYYPSPTDNDPWFYYFICAVRQIGAEEALRKIKDRNKRALYRQKLLEHEPDWWQPELMWAQFLSALKNTGLFPDEIFMHRRSSVADIS